VQSQDAAPNDLTVWVGEMVGFYAILNATVNEGGF
jgi:hypothetical protein